MPARLGGEGGGGEQKGKGRQCRDATDKAAGRSDTGRENRKQTEIVYYTPARHAGFPHEGGIDYSQFLSLSHTLSYCCMFLDRCYTLVVAWNEDRRQERQTVVLNALKTLLSNEVFGSM